jgi:putative transposase
MAVTPRKKIRLAREEYVGRRIYFITICTEKRCPIFADANLAKALVESLKAVSSSMGILVHAFCMMPDHAHLLLEGKTNRADAVKFVARWKQSTGYVLRDQLPRRFWQRRFHDHVLRHAEDSECVAWYIWMNPVRKALVVEAQQYPFSGSFTVEWPRSSAASAAWIPPWKASVEPNKNL